MSVLVPLVVLGARTDATDYAAVVRDAIRIGGCSASRGMLAGACAAALNGDPACVPVDWLPKEANARAELMELTRAVANVRA